MTFALSPGQAHDAPEGRKLLNRLGPQSGRPAVVMGRAYEGNETRQLAVALGIHARCPPTLDACRPLGVRQGAVQKRNEVERLFR